MSEISLRTGGRELGHQPFRRRIERQLERVAAFADRHDPADARDRREARRGRLTPATTSSHPLRLERQHLGQAAARHEPAAREDRDAAAQRLGVAQHVRAEEDRAPAVAQAAG